MGGEMGMIANGCGVSFRARNISSDPIVVLAAQLCKYTRLSNVYL